MNQKWGLLFLLALAIFVGPTRVNGDTNQEPLATSSSAISQASTTVSQIATLENPTDESQVPVFKAPAEKAAVAEKKSTLALWLRMLGSLAVVVALIASGAVAFKKWPHAKGGSRHAKMIQILGQHSLGAKKNLAVVRVAGETILIGVTDQNINLLKTLSLLDEDLPGESIASKSKFSGALKEKVDEEFSMEGIRDIVSRKISDLKGPRT